MDRLSAIKLLNKTFSPVPVLINDNYDTWEAIRALLDYAETDQESIENLACEVDELTRDIDAINREIVEIRDITTRDMDKIAKELREQLLDCPSALVAELIEELEETSKVLYDDLTDL